MTMRKTRLRLRVILFIGFTLISALPVLLLSAWVQDTALEKEVESVREKHLIVAQNLTGALARYVTDVEGGFRMAVRHAESSMLIGDLLPLLTRLHIRSLWIVNGNGDASESLNAKGAPEPDRVNDAVLDRLGTDIAAARREPGTIAFSNLMRDGRGEPVIFLALAMPSGETALGILGMDYIIEVQKTISFGKRGHAAIVDRTGRVMAHPVKEWRTTMKDISFLPPVQRMKAGETGVSKFYTPAMQADMVAGYTTVAGVGWGVMVPQPFEELEARAGEVRQAATLITALGIFVAGLISLLLVRSLTRPIQSVVEAAHAFAAGNLDSRAPRMGRFVAYELEELRRSFNAMVSEVGAKNKQVSETAERLSDAQRIAHLGNWEWNVPDEGQWWSDEIYRMMGFKPQAFKASKHAFKEIIHPEDRERVRKTIRAALLDRRPYSIDHRIFTPRGEKRYVRQQGIAHLDRGGEVERFSGTLLDITESQLAENELRKLSRAVEQSPASVVITDPDGKIEYVNPKFVEVTGYTAAEIQSENLRILRPDDMSDEEYDNLWRTISSGAEWRGELHDKKKNGELYWSAAVIAPITAEDGSTAHFLCMSEDITIRKEYEERLVYQANFDSLTKLPNRKLFIERLSAATEAAQQDARLVALLFIDLDRFKAVNDSFGHMIGDNLLKQAAERLVTCVGDMDAVARLGGDEFAVLLQNIGNIKDVTAIAERLNITLAEPFRLVGREIFIGGSIGITLFPNDAVDPIAMLRNADVAMYRAKDAGRGGHLFYATEMNALALQRMDLESELRRALEQEEFVLHHQPIVDLASGRIAGAEALIRWNHPEKGIISPGEFIPLVESAGLIVPLGAWVLRKACAEAVGWAGEPYVSVNLSSRQLPEGLKPADVAAVLNETGLAANRLIFEITESLIMENTDSMITWLQSVRDLGVRISVDDFGTGYSSLSYLKRLPVDILKIDQSFINDLTGDIESAALVEAIISMAHSLGLRVIAEGVETPEQQVHLQRLDCNYGQGYHFARPAPSAQFEMLLDTLYPAPQARPALREVG